MDTERSRMNPTEVPDSSQSQQLSSEELRHRLDETRSSITSTVWEIKRTMADEYENVRESVSETLDWRTHVARYPMAFSLGALTLGFLLGAGARYASEGEHPHDGHGRRPEVEAMSGQHVVTGGQLVQSIEHSEMYSQVTHGLSDLGTHLVSEVVRLGRDVLIPSLVARLQQRIVPEQHGYETHHETTEGERGFGQGPGGRRFTT